MKNLTNEKAVEGAVTAFALEYIIFMATFLVGTPFLFFAPNVAMAIYFVGICASSFAWFYTMIRVGQGKEALPTEALNDWAEKQEVKNKESWNAVVPMITKALKVLWKCTKIAVACVVGFYAFGLFYVLMFVDQV
jgi:hypothetical protein